jgi:hypothetical protein
MVIACLRSGYLALVKLAIITNSEDLETELFDGILRQAVEETKLTRMVRC